MQPSHCSRYKPCWRGEIKGVQVVITSNQRPMALVNNFFVDGSGPVVCIVEGVVSLSPSADFYNIPYFTLELKPGS